MATLFEAIDSLGRARDLTPVVEWATLALVNAGLAQLKGRSGLAWFGVSLLIGPLATLALVVRPPGR